MLPGGWNIGSRFKFERDEVNEMLTAARLQVYDMLGRKCKDFVKLNFASDLIPKKLKDFSEKLDSQYTDRASDLWTPTCARYDSMMGDAPSTKVLHYLKRKFRGLAIVGTDKCRGEATLMCPVQYKHRLCVYTGQGDGVNDTDYLPRDASELNARAIAAGRLHDKIISDQKDAKGYYLKGISNARIKTNQFGQLYLWPKLKNFGVDHHGNEKEEILQWDKLKERPLVPYTKNVLNPIYGSACRALGHLCSASRRQFGHFSARDVVRRLANLRWPRGSDILSLCVDIKNCYNAFNRETGMESIRKFLREFKDKRNVSYIHVPKKGTIRRKLNSRALMKPTDRTWRNDKYKTSASRALILNNRPFQGLNYVSFPICDLIDIAIHDVDTSHSLVGERVIYQRRGLPTGSPISPGIANMFLSFKENELLTGQDHPEHQIWIDPEDAVPLNEEIAQLTVLNPGESQELRWLDDVTILNVGENLSKNFQAFTKADFYHPDQPLEIADNGLFIGLGFRQIEDPDDERYNCLEVWAVNGNAQSVLDNPPEGALVRPLYQPRLTHFKSAGSLASKETKVLGMCMRVIDHAIGPRSHMLADVWVQAREFELTGYPTNLICRVLKKITAKFRFLNLGELNFGGSGESRLHWHKFCNDLALSRKNAITNMDAASRTAIDAIAEG